MFHAGTCPKCDQGVRGFRTCGQQPVVLCNECEAAWLTPRADHVSFLLQPDLPSPATQRSLIGPEAHWCTRDEIGAAGWNEEITGEVASIADTEGPSIDPLVMLFDSPESAAGARPTAFENAARKDWRFSAVEAGSEHATLEAVVVMSDLPRRTEDIQLALRSNKHVLAPVPWGDIDATRELVSLAEDRQRLLEPLASWPHHPRTLAIRKALDDDTIGEVKRVVIGRSSSDGSDLESLLIEAVMVASWACDSAPRSGSASLVTADSAVVTLVFDGATVVLDVSTDLPKRQWIEIVGSQGSIVCDDIFEPATGVETRFWVHDACGQSTTHTIAAADGQLETLLSAFRSVRTGNIPSAESTALATEVAYRVLDHNDHEM